MNIKNAEVNTKMVTNALKNMNEKDVACLLIVGQTEGGVFHINSSLEEKHLLNLIEDIKHVIKTTTPQNVKFTKES